MAKQKICPGYCGVACVSGYCPKALSKEYPDRAYSTNCKNCFYYRGCEDCCFKGTDMCDHPTEKGGATDTNVGGKTEKGGEGK